MEGFSLLSQHPRSMIDEVALTHCPPFSKAQQMPDWAKESRSAGRATRPDEGIPEIIHLDVLRALSGAWSARTAYERALQPASTQPSPVD